MAGLNWAAVYNTIWNFSPTKMTLLVGAGAGKISSNHYTARTALTECSAAPGRYQVRSKRATLIGIRLPSHAYT
jgi:hypothetical protein